MTLSKLLIDIRNRLLQTLGDYTLADNEATLIIEQFLGIAKERIYLDDSIRISNDDIDRINTIVERRQSGEPLQYIFGKTYFYDREFFVNTDVLIPRPDTEILVDTVINTEKKRPATFIDIGTGSGILAAVLTAYCHDWTAVAIDISFKALQTASRNINNRNLNNIYLICNDMLYAIKPEKRFDFIVSNPPYISSPQMKTLDKSVINYEPPLALNGGEDGLDYYRMISARAKMYLKDTGRIYLEIGFDQGESVPRILRNDGWDDVSVVKDLAGRDRVVTARVTTPDANRLHQRIP